VSEFDLDVEWTATADLDRATEDRFGGLLDYDRIKELAKGLRRPAGTLIALAPQNDPFYSGSPASRRQAEWFAALYRRFMTGVDSFHIRRFHYRLVSQEPGTVRNLNGTPYENTLESWQALCVASKHARYLGLVPMEDFEDHRNPPPVIHLPPVADDPETTVNRTAIEETWLHEELPVPSLALKAPCPVHYHVEIWCEKTTCADVLDRQYGLNVVYGVGELSTTACRDLKARIDANGGRPCRILYVSDFDPAGQSMPLAVARKLEWLVRQECGGDYDIHLRPVVLTEDQCIEYELPRTPIKESEARGPNFEARFGAGATELDALEALHPGALHEILSTEIERYLHPSFGEEWDQAETDVRAEFDTASDNVRGSYADELAPFDERYQKIRADLDQLLDDMQTVHERMEADLVAEAGTILAKADFPEPPDADEDDDPLYDSQRRYVEQIDRYKEHQAKPTSRR
jgi:hypothetical protein